MSSILKAGKITYVTPDYAEHDDWIACDPATTRILRDDEVHFGGKWLETLIGIELDFHGAESQAFMVDGVAFEVLEDPDDGYRSHMAGVMARSGKGYSFYEKPFATVRIEKINIEEREAGSVERMHGYQLIDVKDGHVWLVFGTEWYDDYYPMFRFQYTPKDEA
jgi:hypothetical protein